MIGRFPSVPLDMGWIIKGRLAVGAHPGRTGDAEQYLKALGLMGFNAIVTLTSDSLDRPLLEELDFRSLHIPIQDWAAPTKDQADRASEFIKECLEDDLQLYVHCYAGYGRAGTILAAYLVKMHGKDPFEAIDQVRHARPGAIESQEQERFVAAYALALQATELQEGED